MRPQDLRTTDEIPSISFKIKAPIAVSNELYHHSYHDKLMVYFSQDNVCTNHNDVSTDEKDLSLEWDHNRFRCSERLGKITST